MKKYVKPDVNLVMLNYQDVCAASGESSGASGNPNLKLDGYDFNGPWL